MTDFVISEDELIGAEIGELELCESVHIRSRPLSDELKMERIKTMGCIHAKMRAKFTLAVKEIDAFFESLRSDQ